MRLVVMLLLLWGTAALAQPEAPLVARLSQDRVEVSTTFDGASILVFGSTAQPIGPGGRKS